MTNTPRVAETITLVRAPGGRHFDVFVDGEEFPWVIDGTEPITPVLQASRAPGVTLTLIAKQVRVDDQLLVGADLGHADHDDEGTDDARLDSERASS